MSAPELRPEARTHATHRSRSDPAEHPGLSSLLLWAVAVTAAVAAAVWAFGQHEQQLALKEENARLAAEITRLEHTLASERADAQAAIRQAQDQARAVSPKAVTPMAPRPQLIPRSPPSPTFIPAPAPAPRHRPSTGNGAIEQAEATCRVFRYGTVDERHCRRQAWQRMRDNCHRLRTEQGFVGAAQRDAHDRQTRMWCDAERKFQIIH